MKKLTVIFLAFGAFAAYAAFPVASGGRTVSEIVVPEAPSAEIRFAAQELQKWIARISGAEPGIYHAPTALDNHKIFLGKEFYAPAEDFRFIGNSDGWVVKQQGKKLFISGPEDGGVINGVFRLFDLNTDLIFPRPVLDGEALFTPDADLAFRKTDFRGRPSWNYRQFGLVNVHYDPQTSLWGRRNYSNSSGMFYNKYHILAYQDLFFAGVLSYEFGRFLPNEKYFEAHPEYYAWQEGKRKKYEHYGPQLCYTSPAGREALVRELLAQLEQDMTPRIRKVHFGFGDTWSLCNCPGCRKPIPLEDGTVLASDDDAFRSTQYFLYLNAIVEAMLEKYPHLEAETLGYLYAAVPPKVKPHPKLTVIYCPYPKNDKVSVNAKGNEKWGARSREWAKCGARVGIYEYWGDASDFPRPVADAAAENLRFWNSIGMHHFLSTETYPDVRRSSEKEDKLAGAWDVSAMEYWVLSRLMLDSTQSPQTLRDEYLKRVYGPAAVPIKEYYAAIRRAWHASGRISMYHDNAVQSMELYIRRTGLEKELRTKLESAEKTAKSPAVKQLVRDQRRRFEYLARTAALSNPDIFAVPFSGGDAKVLMDFESSRWKQASKIAGLKIAGLRSKDASGKTKVLLLHDHRNLYVRFQCVEPDMQRLERQKTPYSGRFPSGDRAELFIMPLDGKQYYHFAVTPSGVKYEAAGYDFRWSIPWESVVRRDNSSWECIMRIPLETLGIRITVNHKLKILPARYRGDAESGEESSYTGSLPHNPASFPEMLLQE